mgnify:CR=1 FL=1
MDSKHLRMMVDKIMRLSMTSIVNQVDLPPHVTEAILSMTVDEATRVIEKYLTDEEIQTYAKGCEMILRIPSYKMVQLQTEIKPRLEKNIPDIIAELA